MDTITALLQLPISTLLFLAGFVIVFFALFEVNKGSVKLRTGLTKSNFVPVGLGVFLILGAVYLYRSAATPPGPGSASVAFTTATPPSEPASPTETPVIPTETVSPTDTPIIPTETATQPPIKTIADGCIAVQTWQRNSSDAELLGSTSEQNYCWNLNNLGFRAESDGTLNLVVPRSNAQTTSGIFTPVGSQSVIEFKVRVNSFHIADQAKPAYIGFSIAPKNNPMAVKGSGRFKLQIENTGNAARLYFLLADADETSGSKVDTQNYQYKRTADIRMELNGPVMNVYINNVKLLEAIRIPSEPLVFYIGYDLPLLAGADIEITDVVVDGAKL